MLVLRGTKATTRRENTLALMEKNNSEFGDNTEDLVWDNFKNFGREENKIIYV